MERIRTMAAQLPDHATSIQKNLKRTACHTTLLQIDTKAERESRIVPAAFPLRGRGRALIFDQIGYSLGIGQNSSDLLDATA